MITASTFLIAYPQFAVKDPAEIEWAIAQSSQDCPLDRWRDYTDRGIMLKTAHLLAMDWYETAAISGAAVPLAGGTPARSPGGASGDDGDLDLTTWGRQFKMIRKQVAGAPITFLSGF